jgi:molecular chaperone GrpE
MKKQLEEERAKVASFDKEMTAFKIEYTKQVRENQDTVKRYRKMLDDEKQFAITKFAKDLLEVRDAIRSAVENTDKEAAMKETDINLLREKFSSTIEGQ